MSTFKLSVLVLASLIATAHVAAADDTIDQPRSVATAYELALGGTAASVALFAIGEKSHNDGLVSIAVLSTLVTPSFGQWYAGKPLSAGLGVRVISGAVFFAGIVQSICFDNCSGHASGGGLIALGGLGYIAGAAMDIATSGSAVSDYNAAHRRVQIVPTVMATPSGPATGVGIGGRF